MSLIQISQLTFGYDGSFDNIFENISFQIDSDWKLGLTGRNGRGKTTLLNLLLGKFPYRGTITASVDFDYFPFPIDDKNQDTLQVLTFVAPNAAFWQIKKELSLLDVKENVLYRPFGSLSNGEQTKVLLSALFLKENRFLLIDEPTNHLDMAARHIVADYLKVKKSFILVSHDRAFLDCSVDHILAINKNNIEIQKGNFSSWQTNKDRQDHFELQKNDKLKKEIKSLDNAAKRTTAWSDRVESTKTGSRLSGIKPDKGYIGHQAAKMMKRSQAIEDRRQNAAAAKAALLKNIETAESLALHPLTYPQSRLIEVNHLSLSHGEKIIVKDVSFTIDRGDRLSVQGKNGSGKSSILKLLTGERFPFSCIGSLKIGSQLMISYVPQDTSFLKGGLKEFAKRQSIDESLFKAILRKLDFVRAQFEKDMADFSEGQKKKVLLAKSLCEPAHLYIWDEPLNFIDIISRMQIEELLLQFCPTMIFVEHDQVFCDNIATKQLLL